MAYYKRSHSVAIPFIIDYRRGINKCSLERGLLDPYAETCVLTLVLMELIGLRNDPLSQLTIHHVSRASREGWIYVGFIIMLSPFPLPEHSIRGPKATSQHYMFLIIGDGMRVYVLFDILAETRVRTQVFLKFWHTNVGLC